MSQNSSHKTQLLRVSFSISVAYWECFHGWEGTLYIASKKKEKKKKKETNLYEICVFHYKMHTL